MTHDLLYQCPDCEQFLATEPASFCPTHQQWRDRILAEMDEKWYEDQRRKERLREQMRMTAVEIFGEALSDLVKGLSGGRR